MHPNKLLKSIKSLFIKPEKDWSKADRVVLDVFDELRKQRQNQQPLQLQPLNEATYNGRRMLNQQNPDFQGPMGIGGRGTKDKMPGTTPTLKINPKHRTKFMNRTRQKAPLI